MEKSMKRPSLETILLAGAAALILLSFTNRLVDSVNERAGRAITETPTGNGLRGFVELKNTLAAASVTQWRRALLNSSDLEPFDTYYLLSPKRPLSKREEKLLLDWVKEGGRLVVSFEDNVAAAQIAPFLNLAGINAFMTEQPDFENGKSQSVVATDDSTLIKAGESYQFYALLGFRDGECLVKKERCFLREGAIGKGRLIAFAGVPPFANGLLGLADNPKLATRLALSSGHSAFDEFHQFLTEKSLADFLLDPSILFPLLGFFTITLLYFFFGTGDLQERDLEIERPGLPTASYHALNRMIVQQAFAGGSSKAGEKLGGAAGFRNWQTRALLRLLPRGNEELKTQIEELSGASDEIASRRLIEFHRNWLKGRGRK
jgi:hypothetical protein